MKNAVIFHGGFSSPQHYWIPSIKQFLETRGYSVWAPQLPNADKPTITSWLSYALKNGTYTSQTTLISHSLGGPLVLSILEHLKKPIEKAILVAGFARTRTFRKGQEEPMLQKRYDWKKIATNVQNIIIINSKNDPWGCDDQQGLYMWKRIGGMLILQEKEGHMGSEQFHQPYTQFPLLERLLEYSGVVNQ